ncbi:hypothetical protein [Candidatus Poriferisodalis sp.]|uniref:ApeA N-terminal domain 1-containing protein n=1 Tax=Candidatus Poriferisodalis sp. TaxID=3101277 RepID=UPI003B01925E
MIHGEWWVDKRKRYPRPYVPPRHTAAGELLDEGFTGWRLETLGPLLPRPTDAVASNGRADGPTEPLTIWGTDFDGHLYSLLSAHHPQTLRQMPSVYGGVQIWHVGAIVKSRDAWVEPDELVDQVDVYFGDLDAWASDPSELHDEHDWESDVLSISVGRHSATASVADAEIEVRWGRDVSSSIERVSASPGALIRIIDTLPIFAVADKWSRPLSQLMSLLMMGTSGVTHMRARLAGTSATSRPAYLDVRFPQPFDANRQFDSESSIVGRQHEMLATRKALKSEGIAWSQLLPAYFAAIDDDGFMTTLSLLTASQEKTEGFRFDDSLLYAFNGIESLHSTRFVGHVTEEAQVAKALRELKRQVPPEFKAAINPRLATSRRKWMREKLAEVLGICGGTASALQSACPDLVSVLNDARLAVAHARTEQLSVQEQVDALVSTQWLLRHGLLQALGLDADACDNLILRHLQFKRHVRELTELHSPEARGGQSN